MRVFSNLPGRSGYNTATVASTRPRRRVRILPGNIPNLFRLLFLATVLSVPLILFLQSREPPTSEFVKFLHPLYLDSYSTLLDLEDFRFHLTSDICRKRNETLFALLLVHSAPDHFENRQIIRTIWGRLHLDFGDTYVVRTLFLLGLVEDQRLQSKLKEESLLHGDILQGNFLDSYRNLTYKHVMGLRWAGLNCRRAHFLVKMDDDIFVDIFRLAKALDHKYPLLYNDPVDRSRGRIACYVQKKMPVIRNQDDKWYVSPSEHPADHYPEFCSGWAYALTPSVASRLAHSALYIPYFWVDDVHVTGIVASHAGVSREAMNDCCFSTNPNELWQWIRSPGEYSWRHMVAPVDIDLQLFKDAQRKTLWCQKRRCQCCFKGDQMDSRSFRTSSGKYSAVLTPEWKRKVLNSKVVTSPFTANYVPETSFPEFAFLQMEKWRNNKMIINGLTGETFTYHDSLRLCEKVASALLRLGLKPGQKVAFCSFNLPEYFISWLAVLAAGGIVTDINPNSITKEIKDQVDRTESVIIFTHSSCAVTVKEAAANSPSVRKVVVFGEAEGCIPFSQLAQDDGSLFKGPHPVEDPRTALAQLPCSSGTTGIPKLVCKSHYSFTAMAMSCIYPEILQNTERDVGLLVLPLYHIFPIFMLSADMVVGVTNVLLPKFTPETYLQAIQKHGVTTKPIVPPLVLFMLQHPLVKEYDVSSLRGVVSGAAPVAEDLLDQMQDTFKLDYIRQGFGMTEICPVCVGLNDGKYKKGSVGVPVSQTEVKVIDVETGELLGPNQPGEIWTRGPSVMSGYFNNEEATAATLDKSGWIHTGDIGMYNEECELFVVDRMKDLIKYKGHQVAPAELEHLLLGHPAVKDVAVIGVPDQRAGELTRAYVVVEDSAAGKINEDILIKFVADQTAPEKHLHGGVVFLNEIPKSPAGKVLKKVLRADL